MNEDLKWFLLEHHSRNNDMKSIAIDLSFVMWTRWKFVQVTTMRPNYWTWTCNDVELPLHNWTPNPVDFTVFSPCHRFASWMKSHLIHWSVVEWIGVHFQSKCLVWCCRRKMIWSSVPCVHSFIHPVALAVSERVNQAKTVGEWMSERSERVSGMIEFEWMLSHSGVP